MKIIAAVTTFTVIWISQCSARQISLRPNDPNIIVNRNLTLTCKLRSGSEYTTDAIEFEFLLRDRVSYKRQAVPTKFISRLDNNTWLMRYLINDVRYDLAMISCFPRHKRDVFDSQIIRVGYKPTKPVISPKYVYDWEDFIFTWTIDQRNGNHDLTYIAWFKSWNDRDFRSCKYCEGSTEFCPYQNDSTCIVKKALDAVHPNGLMTFKVNVSNNFGRAESDSVERDLFLWVKPAPVRQVSVVASGSDPRVIRFLAPEPKSGWKHYEKLKYNISVVCRGDNRDFQSPITFTSGGIKINRTLDHLPLYTECNATVHCKPWYTEKKYGIWSDGVTLTFTSQEGVPLAAPEICSSCFFVTNEHSSTRNVVVYFKNPSVQQARGVVRHYRACYAHHSNDDCDYQYVYNTTKRSIHLNLSVDLEYHVTVTAATAAGFNETLHDVKGVIIPNRSSVPSGPGNITVIISQDLSVQFYWNRVERAESYVMVWCKDRDRGYNCNDVQWVRVDSSCSSHSILSDAESIKNMMFGVAAEVDGISSGIVWSDCTYDVRSSLDNLSILPISSSGTSVTLRIEKRPCTPFQAYVYGLIIYFSKLENSDSSNGKVVVFLRDIRNGEYVINELLAESEYIFNIEPLSSSITKHKNITVKAKTSRIILTNGVICGIVLGSVLGLVLIIVGLVTFVRWNRSLLIRCRAYWMGVKIEVPTIRAHDSCQSKENDYIPTGIDDSDGKHKSTLYGDRPEKPDGCEFSDVSEPLINAPPKSVGSSRRSSVDRSEDQLNESSHSEVYAQCVCTDGMKNPVGPATPLVAPQEPADNSSYDSDSSNIDSYARAGNHLDPDGENSDTDGCSTNEGSVNQMQDYAQARLFDENVNSLSTSAAADNEYCSAQCHRCEV